MDLFDGTTAEPRDYQVRICTQTIALLKKHRSVLIESPTGSGKTVIGLALAQYGASIGKRIGWCAMRRHLLTQAEEMRSFFGFQIPGIRYVSMFDRNPPTDIDWFFVDEAQHDATSSMASLHARIRPEKVVGLSATPFRTDGAGISFEKRIRDINIQSLIDGGWLSRFAHYTVPEYSPNFVAELYLSDPAKWGKSVMFFLRMHECERTLYILQSAGIRAEIIWAESDKEDQIARLRSGDIQVLISMLMVAEGLDCDSLRTVFIRPGSKGPAIQMGGRVLRRHPDIEMKQIVQCRKTRFPFYRIAKPACSYVMEETGFQEIRESTVARDMLQEMMGLAMQNALEEWKRNSEVQIYQKMGDHYDPNRSVPLPDTQEGRALLLRRAGRPKRRFRTPEDE